MNIKQIRGTSIAIVTLVCSTALCSAAGYTVRKGDTFAKIAREKGIPLGELLRANKITNPNKITLGQQVSLPGGSVKKTPTASVKTPANIQANKKISPVVAKKAPVPTVRPRPAATPAPAPVKPPAAVKVTAPVKRETASTPPHASGGTHTVQAGDTLSRVKRKYGIPVDELARLNGISATAPLHPGQVLRLRSGSGIINNPPAKTVLALAGAPAESSASAPSGAVTGRHTVQRGETFNSISRLYGLSVSTLGQSNRDIDQTRLRPGQILTIPQEIADDSRQPSEMTPEIRADGRVLAPKPDPLAIQQVSGHTQRRTGYLVEEGDTLGGIARRFYTTEQNLRQMNRMSSALDNIHAGQYILVPFYKNVREGAARYGAEG